MSLPKRLANKLLRQEESLAARRGCLSASIKEIEACLDGQHWCCAETYLPFCLEASGPYSITQDENSYRTFVCEWVAALRRRFLTIEFQNDQGTIRVTDQPVRYDYRKMDRWLAKLADDHRSNTKRDARRHRQKTRPEPESGPQQHRTVTGKVVPIIRIAEIDCLKAEPIQGTLSGNLVPLHSILANQQHQCALSGSDLTHQPNHALAVSIKRRDRRWQIMDAKGKLFDQENTILVCAWITELDRRWPEIDTYALLAHLAPIRHGGDG